MSSTSSQKVIFSSGDEIASSQSKDGDKPIPFLRRLIDMLQENEEIISFHPGTTKKNGQFTPGQIVVHDRSRVESEILPRYFNHSSFASLRRQLNYFAFCRVGKGKQKGATYCNEKVINILDILRLKRRAVGSTIPVVQSKKLEESSEESSFTSTATKTRTNSSRSPKPRPTVSLISGSRVKSKTSNSSKNKKRKKPSRKSKEIIESVVPVVHLPKRVKVKSFSSWKTLEEHSTLTDKKGLSVSVSPPPEENLNVGAPKITLDLTQPPASIPYANLVAPNSNLSESCKTHSTKEDDVLAGCSALLALGFQSTV